SQLLALDVCLRDAFA
ncbi:DUF645 family protein, partial [Vibrio cholerae]|nr:DUF645 family protein [Vibrio cholerae]MBC9070268.1 DUF645 family protein [Vibrio cholerae]MBC9070323.1 DUF645 family protein [Vibrio cholerae]MCX9465809.1 DUF645 family protein [Vibrio cholerae]NOF92187.1 DUF645 family protein [Vibrio cholerae]